ncbi:MAG: ABC transporter substrate-binding protein [Proteobacteria bacterium]|nr:ABC transporter substrate-binding protein [Pseudomonadota bacterium]
MKSLFVASAAAAAMIAGTMASTPVLAQDKEVRVGFLAGLSGGRGAFGKVEKEGFDLAIDHLGGKLGGLPIKYFVEDTQNKPDVGRQQMDKLIKKDKVHFVAGITWSNVLAAVYKQALDNEVFLISVNAGWSKLSGELCNPYFFRASWNNDDTPEAMGQALQASNLKDVWLMAPNYQAGKDMVSGFTRYYKGKITGTTFFKLGQSDYQAELSQIRAAKPSSIFAFAPGGMGVALVKQYKAAGMDKTIPLNTAFVVDYLTLGAFGKSAIGNVHASFWDPTSKNPANVRFIADYKKKYGKHPSMYAVQGYDAALLIDLGVRAAGGDLSNKDAIRAGMRSANISSPRGGFQFNNNHNPIQNYYKRQVVAGPDGEPTIVTTETVFRAHKDAYHTECKMNW